ncbi:MAG: mgtE-like transporter [Actinomycetota bacterium]|jgi:mgtE-like transporter|nr:mgtE-like transporter [Actinomycetota bacterium]
MASRRERIQRRAKRLFGYWRAERRTLRQGLVALALSTLAGFVAGLTLQGMEGTLRALPGLLILIPAAVGMRGTIFGAIGARLGTQNAAGTFEISFRKGTPLRQNAEVAVLTTFSSSLWLAVLASAAGTASGKGSIGLGNLITISVVGGVLGSLLILGVTVALSVVSYRRGWDLDSVSTPMVTALGDMATLPTLYLATLLLHNHTVSGVMTAVCVAIGLLAAVRSYAVRDLVVRRVVVQMTAVILLTPLLDIVSGALQQGRLSELHRAPVLLALIPPFVSQAGALGGIFASRISSKLQIGVVTPKGFPEIPALVDASLVLILGLAVFAFIGVVAVALTSIGHHVIAPMTVIVSTEVAGMIAVPLTIILSYYLAVLSYRFGLDPDDQTVPIITSVMDLAGVVCLLFVMSVSGVLPHG